MAYLCGAFLWCDKLKVAISCCTFSWRIRHRAGIWHLLWGFPNLFCGAQGYLLEWLFEFYAYLDEVETLRDLFGVFFRMLKIDSLRVRAARLLCLVAAPHHVTAYHVGQVSQNVRPHIFSLTYCACATEFSVDRLFVPGRNAQTTCCVSVCGAL